MIKFLLTIYLLSFSSVFGASFSFIQHVIDTTSLSHTKVSVIDLDGDNDLDVLGCRAWYENDGNQNFTAHIFNNISYHSDLKESVAIDLDNDQDLDIVSAFEFINLVWYENDGNQNFNSHVINDSSLAYRAVYAIDMDNDNDIDVLTALGAPNHRIMWYENDGNQNFFSHIIYSSTWGGPIDVLASDFDSDNDIDVFSASFDDGKIFWHENNNDQTFTNHIIDSTSTPGVYSILLSHLDNDLDIDILSVSYFSNIGLTWFENVNNQNFFPHSISYSLGCAFSIFALDLDGDADTDIISSNEYNDLVWFENNGSQTFTIHTLIANIGWPCWSVYAIDLDHNQDIDIVTAVDDKIIWYENDGIISMPVIFIEPMVLDFGNVLVDNTAELSFDIHNRGDDTLSVSAIHVSNNAFTTNFNPNDSLISPNDSLRVTVLFTPTQANSCFDSLTIINNDITKIISLIGNAITGPSVDEAVDVAVDNSGNVYVTGHSDNSKYVTIKYDSAGNERWVSYYNSTSTDVAQAITVDNRRNVYVTGYSYGFGTSTDYLTVKYDSSGVEQWVARYNGPENNWDEAYAICLDSIGNVCVTGASYSPDTYWNYATIKYDTLGIEQWVVRYNGPANSLDVATALTVDRYNNVYVTGYSEGTGTDFDYYTIKYNYLGTEQWAARYNGTGNDPDEASSIAVDSLGNVYVTGFSYGIGTASDYTTIKYDSTGEQLWVARYNGPANADDRTIGIAIDNLLNVYISGWSFGSATNIDYATVKYNSMGLEQWVARFNGPANNIDNAQDMLVDNLGNVYVTGASGGSDSFDYATVKYNSSGIEQWTAFYNGPGGRDDQAYSISLDKNNNVYVTGRSWGSTTTTLTSYDFATVKYNSSGVEQWVARYDGTYLGITDDQNPIPEEWKLNQNYPNPFNPKTTIRYQIPKPSWVKLQVFNMLGQKVKTLVNKFMSAGSHEVDFNSGNLPSGVYLYRISAGGFHDVKKMVLIR